MNKAPFTPSSRPGTLHNYLPRLVAFEHAHNSARNTLLFIGGLGDGLYTVPYVGEFLKDSRITDGGGGGGWSVVEVLVRSGYKGWGVGSIVSDAKELAACVSYFKKLRPDGRIVLMGHSTGCQDIMEYIRTPEFNTSELKLDGAIIQAPLSDRECLLGAVGKEKCDASVAFSKKWIDEGRGEEIVPSNMRPVFEKTPICARRWYSLAAPLDANELPQGEEDFFSSDISAQGLKPIFGKICPGNSLLILYSGRDEFALESVNKEELVSRWVDAIPPGVTVDLKNSGVIQDASHSFKNAPRKVLDDLLARVSSFLETHALVSKDI